MLLLQWQTILWLNYLVFTRCLTKCSVLIDQQPQQQSLVVVVVLVIVVVVGVCYFDCCCCDSYSFNVNASYGRLFCLSVSICFELRSPARTAPPYCAHFLHTITTLPHIYMKTYAHTHTQILPPYVCVDMQQLFTCIDSTWQNITIHYEKINNCSGKETANVKVH